MTNTPPSGCAHPTTTMDGRCGACGESVSWERTAQAAVAHLDRSHDLLSRWLDEAAAMGGGSRSQLTQDTLDALGVRQEKGASEVERVAAALAWWWRNTQNSPLDHPRNEMSWWIQPARIALKAADRG